MSFVEGAFVICYVAAGVISTATVGTERIRRLTTTQVAEKV
jgi:hypothetical protein